MNSDPASGCEPRSIAGYKALYDRASRLAKIGAWECDLATEELTWTDGVYDLFELPSGARLERATIVDLYDEESRRQMELMRAEAIRSGGHFVLDAQIRTSRGARRWMRLTAEVAREPGGPPRLFGAKQDITAEQEAWGRLRQLAERDPLTGLVNRRVFEERCRDLMGGSAASASALALVDLDRFKAINDRFGHAAGDECLRQAAMRLARVFRDAILVARLGGDEFAILLRGNLSRGEIVSALDRALLSLGRPVIWNGLRIDGGASIGVAILDGPDRHQPAKAFAAADQALYAAKASGRNAVRIAGDPPHLVQSDDTGVVAGLALRYA